MRWALDYTTKIIALPPGYVGLPFRKSEQVLKIVLKDTIRCSYIKSLFISSFLFHYYKQNQYNLVFKESGVQPKYI